MFTDHACTNQFRYFIDPRDEPLSRAIVSYWLTMARDGRPSPGTSTIGTAWPAWNETDGRGLVIGDNAAYTAPELIAVGALQKAKCDFFDRIFFNASRPGPTEAHRAALQTSRIAGV